MSPISRPPQGAAGRASEDGPECHGSRPPQRRVQLPSARRDVDARRCGSAAHTLSALPLLRVDRSRRCSGTSDSESDPRLPAPRAERLSCSCFSSRGLRVRYGRFLVYTGTNNVLLHPCVLQQAGTSAEEQSAWCGDARPSEQVQTARDPLELELSGVIGCPRTAWT